MSRKKKRHLEVLIISDVHLGTYGCKAKELLQYLRSVDPDVLILNGDIVDIWQFKKSYFPKSHMKVVKYLTHLLAKGKTIYYITGNHDEMLRKFAGFKLGNFQILNKLVWTMGNKKAWIFHGDVFDITMKHSKWIAKLGAHGYDFLILINTLVNWLSLQLGRGKISLSKRIKNSVKGAIKFIDNFEETAAEIAIDNGYEYVICGHIHQPQMKRMAGKNGGEVIYLNSGDWVENMTALEYADDQWSLFSFEQDFVKPEKELSAEVEESTESQVLDTDTVFENSWKSLE